MPREKKFNINDYISEVDSVSTVNHPSHYNFSRFEVIDVLEEWFPDDPLLWQVAKYIARAAHKGDMITDLEKAQFYLSRRISKCRRVKESAKQSKQSERSMK